MSKIFNVRIPARNLDIALLLMRVGIAGFMLVHGIPKINMFNETPVQFMDFMGTGPEFSLALTIFAEVVCSVLLLVGLATRLAAIPLIITMLVAVLMVHGADPFDVKEMALHYLLVYVVLLLLGAGKYSLDAQISKKI
jgi:putative oxidoreductase